MSVLDTRLERYLGGWEPIPAAARELGRLYCGTLNQRVAERCIELLAETGDGHAARTEELLSALAESGWTTPSLAFAHHVTLPDPERAPEAARRAVGELERVASTDTPELELSPGGPLPQWAGGALGMFTADQRLAGGQFVYANAVTPDTETLAACRIALQLLARCWPEMARTTETFVRELRWFVGPDDAVISVTLTQAFGAVFLVPTRSIALYEALVHEATHLELMARMAIDKLIANGGQLARSPFRPDQRPLTRVLHAALVAVRVQHALGRCHDLLDREDQGIAASQRALFVANARNGLATLGEQGQLTPIGRELLASMRAEIDHVSGPNETAQAAPKSP